MNRFIRKTITTILAVVLLATSLCTGAAASSVSCSSFVYGTSVRGRNLVCWELAPAKYNRTVLLNFAIHGFEDSYDADGQRLVDAANSLINYYKSANLGSCRLLIVPCANPDGLYDGNTNNGFGRCNADGIDLNRDFDAAYRSMSSSRNYTPHAFSGVESRALRDLYNEYRPDVVIDFHGWLDETIGDIGLAGVFYEEMGLVRQYSFNSTNAPGFFSHWAHDRGSLALLVEFPESGYVPLQALKNSVNRIVSGDYTNEKSYCYVNKAYGGVSGVQCYTRSTGDVTTYADVYIPFSNNSYIDGKSDLCTINNIYESEWVNVTYPVSSGKKTAYCPLSVFISPSQAVTPYSGEVLSKTTVYRRSDMSVSFGEVWAGGTFTVVAHSGNTAQIIYPINSGGYKMGWIYSSSLALTGISVKSLPKKTAYYAGDSLNPSGLTLTARYKDGSTKTISSGFVCSPVALTSAGTKQITVSYGGKTTSFKVEVSELLLTKIIIKSKPLKLSYYTGDTLNTSGLALTASYNNSTTKTVTSGFKCSPTVLNNEGTQKITVSWGGKSTSFTVDVKPLHVFSDEWTVDVPANCTQTGVKSHHCTLCDDRADVTVIPTDPDNHILEELRSIDFAPTVTDNGQSSVHCTLCSAACDVQPIPLLDESDTEYPSLSIILAGDAPLSLTDGGKVILAMSAITGEELLSHLAQGEYAFLDCRGKVLTATENASTGQTVVLMFNGMIAGRASVCVLGDVNGDGIVTTDDARTALRTAVGLDTLNGVYRVAAAVASPSTDEVTTDDARRILRIAVGLE